MLIEWWHPFRLGGGWCSLCRAGAAQAARGLTSSGGHRSHCKEHSGEVHVHRRTVCRQVLPPCSAAHMHATVPRPQRHCLDRGTSTSDHDPVKACRAVTANREVACTYIGEPAVRGTLVLRSEEPDHAKQVGQDLHAPAHAGMTSTPLRLCRARCKRRKQRACMRTRPQNRISPTYSTCRGSCELSMRLPSCPIKFATNSACTCSHNDHLALMLSVYIRHPHSSSRAAAGPYHQHHPLQSSAQHAGQNNRGI